MDAEPKDDKLVSSKVFLDEAAAYVSCCCCCRSGRILEPLVLTPPQRCNEKLITVAMLMMRISIHGLAAQAILVAEEEGGQTAS